MVQELSKLIFGDTQVGYRESIRNIPSERTELLTLEAKSIEEDKAPKKSAECDGFLAFLELFVVKCVVETANIVTQALGWLSSDLDRVLYNSNRELIAGHSCKPNTELTVGVTNNFLNETVKQRQESGRQMAILKNNPSLCLLSLFDFTDSFWCLTLTERERLELDLLEL